MCGAAERSCGHRPVVVVRRQTECRRELRVAGVGALAFLLACSAVVLRDRPAGQRDGGRQRRVALLQSELRLRSAHLVIKDLASEWDQANFNEEPFDFCGRARMTSRQVKVCADYFLASLPDTLGDDKQGDGKLFHFPQLAAFSKCTQAPTNYMIKACIREVTRAMTPQELIHQSRTGSTGEDKELDRIASYTIDTAEPDAAVDGLNGGIAGGIAEMSSKKYLEKEDSVGDVSQVTAEGVQDATGWSPEPGCTDLGMGGCDSPTQGGIKTKIKAKALAALAKEPAPSMGRRRFF
jgi:hypothetical protein